MSKKKTTQKKQPGKKVLTITIILAVLAIAAVIVALALSDREPDNTGTASGTFGTVGNDNTISIEDLEDVQISTDKDLVITDIGNYSGIFMEDGSDEVVSRILMVVVKNTGSKTVQYAEVELTDGEKTAYFSLSTLPPGESVVLLEKSRMSYADGKNLTEATVKNAVAFSSEPTMCQDQLKIQGLNGVLNVTNTTDEDITGDVVIYYKNAASDMLYGGITYRVTITGGIKAGEIKQIVASHYSEKGSRVMWVTVG